MVLTDAGEDDILYCDKCDYCVNVEVAEGKNEGDTCPRCNESNLLKARASHSPYMYNVSFSFTVVSEFNTVQYAEDILDVGFNGGYADSYGSYSATLTNATNANPISQEKYKNSTVNLGDGNSSIIYDIQGHAGEEGTTINKTASFANTIEYMKDLGLPTDSNGASKLAGMAEITSGLTAIVETQINKKYGDKITRIFGK